MAQILRVKLRWSGFQGAPGYSIFHFKDFEGGDDQAGFAQGAVDRVDDFITAISPLTPGIVTLQTESDVEVLEDSTGELITAVTTTPDAPKTNNSSGGGNFASAVGAVVTWRTGTVRNGRRVRGRTFLVPLKGSSFDTDGTLLAATVTSLNAAATAMVAPAATPDLGVYARPSGPAATDGAWAVATGFSVPDMGAILRSRRD